MKTTLIVVSIASVFVTVCALDSMPVFAYNNHVNESNKDYCKTIKETGEHVAGGTPAEITKLCAQYK